MPIYGTGIGSRTNLSTLVALNSQQPSAAVPTPTCNRRSVPQVADPPAFPYSGIIDNGNTSVSYLGAGEYVVSKTGGADGTWDAGAIGQLAFAGDFVLKIEDRTPGFIGAWEAGVSAAPAADNSNVSPDYSWQVAPAFAQFVTVSSGGTGRVFTAAGNPYYWMWRLSGTLYWGRGPDLATAMSAPDDNVAYSSTCYFDSSFNANSNAVAVSIWQPFALAGVASLSLAASGAETAAATLAGTSPLAFATPTEQLRGAIPAVGSSALTFTPSGAETAKGTLAGSTSGLFTGSAGESAGGVLVGSSALIFTPAGSTTAAGALASTSALTFAGSAVLLGAVGISATASVSFTPAGIVVASASLAGAGSLSFVPSSTLTGTTALTQVIGAGSITFSTAGNVRAFARLAGSASIGWLSVGSGQVVSWRTPEPGLAALTVTPSPSAIPLAVTASPATGTFLQDNDPVQLEWSA